jgi:hypothetical protein
VDAPLVNETVFVLRVATRGQTYEVVEARVTSTRPRDDFGGDVLYFSWYTSEGGGGDGERLLVDEGATWARPEDADRLRVVAALR